VAIAPLPKVLPGLFFVLEHFRDSGYFKLYLDDDVGTSHLIKMSPTELSKRFQDYGLDPVTANDAVDRAIEFHSVQVIPAKKQVISLHRRTPARSVISFEEEPSNAFQYI
jgi:hypothetical protein